MLTSWPRSRTQRCHVRWLDVPAAHLLAGAARNPRLLVGIEPEYVYDDDRARPGGAPSATLRTSVTGEAAVSWREGLRRTVEFWEPRIGARQYPLAR